ncbi:hypothetical protein [Nonomuraea rosea]|uniref:hypothetical protein n=1 Tax=Nonomuraea rosea TaxID=638574 RepID=UPI0031EDCAFB
MKIQNALIQIRADQQELAQDLTERINGVGNQVKRLEGKCDAKFAEIDKRFEAVDKRFEAVDKRFDAIDDRFDKVDDRFDTMQDTQTTMMHILVGIQRKLDAD